MKIVKKFICTIIILTGLALACAAAAGIYWTADFMNYARRAETDPDASWETVVDLPSGTGFSEALGTLASTGVVQDTGRFRLLARILGYDRRIQAGEYLFTSAMTPLEILQRLVRGKVRLYGLTIPEGLNLREIAALVADQGFGDQQGFLACAMSPEYAEESGIQAASLEGYLFPDTYSFPRGTDVDRIIQAMLDQFDAVFTPLWAAGEGQMNLSRHEVVTLASIIEKETGAPEERPRIASVFHNRLARGMRLQSDPTVIYDAKDYDGNLTRAHLDAPTPYNTYRIAGLPPGPIASPGRAALEAALFPEETDYLYFVARGDGTHHFSTTLEEHNRAVRRYQLGGGDR
jgi:UPF0755 protein